MSDVPFRVGEQVSGEFFTDREEEVRRIRDAMSSPTRLLVYGERRQGKSSAIRQAQARAERDRVRVVWVDLSTAVHIGDVAQRIVSAIPFRWKWREELQLRLVNAHLRVEARADAGGSPVLALVPGTSGPDAEEGRLHLQKIIGSLDHLAGEKGERVVIVLDEFQEIDNVLPRGGWFIRDLMQSHHHLSFICAGSNLSLIDDLISPTGPLHRFFEPLTIGPIDSGHLARWIESRLEGGGVRPEAGIGLRILELVGPRTQDCLQLARSVFFSSVGSGRAALSDLPEILRRSVLEDRDRFETIWQGLAQSHRGVLRAVAAGETQLGGQDVRRRYSLPTPAAVSKAVAVLRTRRLLGMREPVSIEDPYFREWVLLQAMEDGLPHARPGQAP